MARDDTTYPIGGMASGITTPQAAGAIVIGSVVLLILINRGFRGVRVPGVGSINL